ncbi:MAG: hypothetical protein IPL88_13110 [Rhizobiales bacterium]|nr:hypothetical protein [Hyphomicrobiales bacterium]
MNAAFLKHMALGFLVAAALAGAATIGFLLIPGAAMFFIVAPLLGVAAVVGLLLLFCLTGRFGYAAGVALFAAAVLVSPYGRLVTGSVAYAARSLKTSSEFSDMVAGICAKDVAAPKRTDLPPLTRVVFENLGNISYAGYDAADTVALLTGREVVEIRESLHAPSVMSTIARPLGDCGPSERARIVEPTRMGQGPFPKPVKIDVCLDRRKTTKPTLDEAAIVLRRGKDIMGCDRIDVFQRAGGSETLLGAVGYQHGRDVMSPDLRRRGETRRGDWFLAMLRAALGQEIGEAALLTRVARD